jgi:hypothetical protein
MRIPYLIAGAAAAAISVPSAALAMTAPPPGGQITGHHVVNGSLTGADIKDGSLHRRDLSSKLQRQIGELNGLGGTIGGDSFKVVTGVGIDSDPSDTDYSFHVSCPDNEPVISGGAFRMTPSSASLVGSFPANDLSSWTGRVTKPATDTGQLAVQVWAVCFDGPIA